MDLRKEHDGVTTSFLKVSRPVTDDKTFRDAVGAYTTMSKLDAWKDP